MMLHTDEHMNIQTPHQSVLAKQSSQEDAPDMDPDVTL